VSNYDLGIDLQARPRFRGVGGPRKHFELYRSHQVPKFYCAARRNGEMSNKI